MSAAWQPAETAPKDGSVIRIRGRRFMTETRYEATAVWTRRRCPTHECDGFFPPTDKHDGMGPYEDVESWRPWGCRT